MDTDVAAVVAVAVAVAVVVGAVIDMEAVTLLVTFGAFLVVARYNGNAAQLRAKVASSYVCLWQRYTNDNTGGRETDMLFRRHFFRLGGGN